MEGHGIPTANISLVKLHTEKVKPPRSLWVPFELGRPLGIPNDPGFQRKVLLSLLDLFEITDGPFVLEDFPEDAPETDEEIEISSCPVNFDTDTPDDSDPLRINFTREIQAMRPWYDMSLKKLGRTTVGGSGIDTDSLSDFLYSFIKEEPPDNPRSDVDISVTLKLAAEDIKSYYIEGITAQPGQEGLSSKALDEWFWNRTAAGEVLIKLAQACSKSKDEGIRMTGSHFIVPLEVLVKKRRS